MVLHATTAALPHTPLATARRPGLRLALGGSLLLHGVAVAWMLQAPAPEAVDAAPLVQVAILEAPPPLVPPQPVAPPEPVHTETPPPVAVKAPDGRPEPEPLPEKKSEPEPEIIEQAPPEVPTEVVELTPPVEPSRVAQVEAPQATVTPPVYEADYLSNPPPSYPRLSRRLREEGEVELRVRVDPAGQPVVVELARSSGSGRLDEAALRAVRDWRFAPARRGGQAVEAWVRVPILFKLEA